MSQDAKKLSTAGMVQAGVVPSCPHNALHITSETVGRPLQHRSSQNGQKSHSPAKMISFEDHGIPTFQFPTVQGPHLCSAEAFHDAPRQVEHNLAFL